MQDLRRGSGDDIDRQFRDGKPSDPAAFYAQRFPQETAASTASCAGTCSTILDRASAQALAKQLTRILRPDGALLAFFNTTEPAPGVKPNYTRHVVVDPSKLQYRPYPDCSSGRSR